MICSSVGDCQNGAEGDIPRILTSFHVLVKKYYPCSQRDPTSVDKELQECREKNLLRTFKIFDNNIVVALERDFRSYTLAYDSYSFKEKVDLTGRDIDGAVSDRANKKARIGNKSATLSFDEDKIKLEKKILRDFHDGVLLHWTDQSITREEIITFMRLENQEYENQVFTLLCRLGFLVRKTNAPSGDSFNFSFPGIGQFGTRVSDARKYIISRMKRNKFKEILETEIVKISKQGQKCSKRRKLADVTKRTPLFYGAAFHLDDIIGAGLVRVVKTPAGRLLKLND